VQNDMTNLQVRTTRLEGPIAQVLEQIKEVQELNKEMMEGVRAICEGFNAAMPWSRLPKLDGIGRCLSIPWIQQSRHQAADNPDNGPYATSI
jgi:hypothetical protein